MAKPATYVVGFFIAYFELSIIFNIFTNMGTQSKIITDVDDVKTFLTIDANKSYSDFQTFYQENKDTIYKGIISLYEQFGRTKNQNLKIVVKSIIVDYKWDANLIFEKSDTKALMTFILPYYENNEEFETCAHIMKIYKKLQ